MNSSLNFVVLWKTCMNPQLSQGTCIIAVCVSASLILAPYKVSVVFHLKGTMAFYVISMWTIIRLSYKLWGNLLSDSKWAACHGQGNFIDVKINCSSRKRVSWIDKDDALYTKYIGAVHLFESWYWNRPFSAIRYFLAKAPFMFFFSQIKKVYVGDDAVKSLTTIYSYLHKEESIAYFSRFLGTFSQLLFDSRYSKSEWSACVLARWCGVGRLDTLQ